MEHFVSILGHFKRRKIYFQNKLPYSGDVKLYLIKTGLNVALALSKYTKISMSQTCK